MPDIAAQQAIAVIKLKDFFMSFITSLSLFFNYILPLNDYNVNTNYNLIPDNQIYLQKLTCKNTRELSVI
ncbi:hypothetical protein Osc2_06820 [Ruminococcus sp. 25CYCFAH16]|jgi:hypothetical protein